MEWTQDRSTWTNYLPILGTSGISRQPKDIARSFQVQWASQSFRLSASLCAALIAISGTIHDTYFKTAKPHKNTVLHNTT
jgi:hypothetical protein